ncbi:androglobin-like isoform X9 [Ptychodera flava]|uniref:androglobin-like isoform X9 n=1 Tax=Ptychodera flava TaxID=63121 RepID=UPI003969BFB1
MTSKRERVSPDHDRERQSDKMPAYARETIYPVLSIPIEEVYDRASKLLGRKLEIPSNNGMEEKIEEEDSLPELSSLATGKTLRNRSRADRRGSVVPGDKKTSSINLAGGDVTRGGGGGRRASAFASPTSDGRSSFLPGIEELNSSRKMSAPMGDDPRRTMVPSGSDIDYWRDRAASIAASVIGSTGEAKRHKPVIWPEFTEQDINQEKWDTPHKGKEKDKGKSPNLQHFFDDPEGRIEMPPSLKQRVDHWKRPQDFILDKTPVVFDENVTDFDLMTANEHIHDSELIRWITSQISTLWQITMTTDQDAAASVVYSPPTNHTWKPWEHIYSMSKVGKGPHMPLYNPHGKYVVKLYWMGVWRKIVVDDTIPFDDNEKMLLPATTLQHELWPMLLSKALIKVASLDYNGGSTNCEFGDVTVIHCLTGWLPETIPLQYGHINQVWELLKTLLPEFKLPKLEEQKAPELDMVKKDSCKTDEISKDGKKDDKAAKENKEKEKEKAEKAEKPAKEKDHKEEKGGKKDKDKDKDKRPGTQGDQMLDKDGLLGETAGGPQVALYVSYEHPPPVPVRVSMLGEMADASERLRQSGLSHVFPHPLLLTRTRSCPLVAPPPPPVVPAWKLIRQKKKKTTPHDQPPEPEIKRPEQWVEVTSPYVNYKVSPIPIPTEVKRPRSSLSRGGGSRPSTALMGEIVTEGDEDNPEKAEEMMLLREKQKLEEKIKAEKEAEQKEAEAKAELQAELPPKPDTPSKDSKDGKDKKGAKDDKKDGKREKSAAKLEKIEEPKPSRKISAGLKKKESTLAEKAPSLKSEKTEKSDKEKVTPMGKDTKEKDGTLKPGDVPEGDAMSVLTETGSKAEGSTNEGERDTAEEEQKEKKEVEPVQKDIWMHFEDFAKCFKTLYIFHKPNTYIGNHKMADLKKLEQLIMQKQQAGAQNVQPTNAKTKSAAPGGPTQASSMTAQTPARQPFSPSPQHHHHDGKEKDKEKVTRQTPVSSTPDERQPHYLFVDNLEPTEIIVSFSSLSRWFDPPPEQPKTSHSTIRERKDRESDKDSVAASGGSLLEVASTTKDSPVIVTPGLLVAEPYSWKSLVVGQPVLRIRSTSTRAAALSLPPGRHVLRFMMNAPLGYHVHLCSTVSFVFGDEETVMSHLTKESCRFVDHANQVMLSIKNTIQVFDDKDNLSEAMNKLALLHYPVNEGVKAAAHNFEQQFTFLEKRYLYKVFNEALYTTLRAALGESFTLEMVFAWKAFNFDVLTRNVLGGMTSSGSRPATGASRKSAKAGRKHHVDHNNGSHEGEIAENWVNREPTEDETAAATAVQKFWRGYYVRKIRIAREPGNKENEFAKEHLVKSWTIIEPNMDQHALTLFRTMFKIDPDLMPKFPFYQDEWNKISYSDYQGNYPDQPPNTWFVVFRDVFYVQEPMLLVPKLYVSIPTCMLRVVDNDTGEEIPRVFQRVAPYEYKRNKRGYTFVAEARTTDMPLPSGKWRMRLIGSLSPLPQPIRENLTSTFNVKEIRDYYLPNDNNIILRYSVKVLEDQIASVQLCTSKPDVYILLQVLDNEVKVTETTGKGHVVIPAFTFLRDREPGEEAPRRSSSRASQRGGSKLHTSLSSSSVSSAKKRQESAGSRDGRGSRGSRGSAELHRHDDDLDGGSDKEQEIKPHKYIIQAKVLRKSWPLSESSWAFVQVLKDLEKTELKANKDRPISAPKSEKAAASQGKGGGKKGKDKGKEKEKDKDKGSRPPSQQFDISKPNWILRVVLEQTPTEEIEIKKDTERQDEIRAMKQAWEAAEPGRAAKAQESRRKFLEENMIKVEKESEDEESKDIESSEPVSEGPPKTPASELEDNPADAILTNEPPPPPPPKEILREIDRTPFLRNSNVEPRLLDEEEMRREQDEQQRTIQEYRLFREEVLESREEDRKRRNAAKERQIEDCEKLQATLDMARAKINEPREAFRQKFLEAERKRLEEIAAQEAALKAEQEKSSPSPKGRKSAKGKKSAGKKKK